MKTATEKALSELQTKLAGTELNLIENYEEKMEVLRALSKLHGVEAPLKELLEETMADLEKIQSAAKESAAS